MLLLVTMILLYELRTDWVGLFNYLFFFFFFFVPTALPWNNSRRARARLYIHLPLRNKAIHAPPTHVACPLDSRLSSLILYRQKRGFRQCPVVKPSVMHRRRIHADSQQHLLIHGHRNALSSSNAPIGSRERSCTPSTGIRKLGAGSCFPNTGPNSG